MFFARNEPDDISQLIDYNHGDTGIWHYGRARKKRLGRARDKGENARTLETSLDWLIASHFAAGSHFP